MELKIDKKFMEEAVQRAVEDIKQNFVPVSVIEDIKAEIEKVMRKNNIGMAGEEPFNDGCKRCL